MIREDTTPTAEPEDNKAFIILIGFLLCSLLFSISSSILNFYNLDYTNFYSVIIYYLFLLSCLLVLPTSMPYEVTGFESISRVVRLSMSPSTSTSVAASPAIPLAEVVSSDPTTSIVSSDSLSRWPSARPAPPVRPERGLVIGVNRRPTDVASGSSSDIVPAADIRVSTGSDVRSSTGTPGHSVYGSNVVIPSTGPVPVVSS